MSDTFPLYVFLASCAALLLWGMTKRSRIYEYPFLIGGIFSAFLVPQAFSLVQNPGIVSSGAVSKTLYMGSLCMLMSYLGYTVRPWSCISYKLTSQLNLSRLFVMANITMAVSLAAVWEMGSIPIEEIQAGTGLFTILAFLSGFSAIAFPYFLLRLFEQKRSMIGFVYALVSGYPVYSAMIFAGRRGQTAEMIIFVVFAVYFKTKLSVGRLPALAGILVTAYLIPVFAAVRQEFWVNLFGGKIESIPFSQSIDAVLQGDVLELRNAAATIEGTIDTGVYGYGTGYWDALVFRYIPGQLLGFDFKNSLQFRWGASNWDVIGYSWSNGSTSTAIADTFQQFGYFGAIFFFLQGMIFRNIWAAAIQGSILGQIAYIALVPLALLSVTHSSAWFFQGGLIVWLLLFATNRFARMPISTPVVNRRPRGIKRQRRNEDLTYDRAVPR